MFLSLRNLLSDKASKLMYEFGLFKFYNSYEIAMRCNNIEIDFKIFPSHSKFQSITTTSYQLLQNQQIQDGKTEIVAWIEILSGDEKSSLINVQF